MASALLSCSLESLESLESLGGMALNIGSTGFLDFWISGLYCTYRTLRDHLEVVKSMHRGSDTGGTVVVH